MSAFEGKADMAFAFAVAIGGKADMPSALHSNTNRNSCDGGHIQNLAEV